MTEHPKRPRDPNQLAKFIVDVATGEKKPVGLSDTDKRAGGTPGGKARADALTNEQRKEFARIAADARWKKSGPDLWQRVGPGQAVSRKRKVPAVCGLAL